MAQVMSVLLCLPTKCSAEEAQFANHTRAWERNVLYALGSVARNTSCYRWHGLRFGPSIVKRRMSLSSDVRATHRHRKVFLDACLPCNVSIAATTAGHGIPDLMTHQRAIFGNLGVWA